MSSLVLSQVTTSMFAPSIYGTIANGASIASSGALWSAAQGIAGAIGAIAGSVLDRMLFTQSQNYQGPRLSDLSVQTSTEGASLPIVFGTMRLAGNVIWSTGLTEIATTEDQGGGSGGGGSSYTTYSYTTDCAVAICEGTITGIRRIWADTKLIYDVSETASIGTLVASSSYAAGIRIYDGSETQLEDPLIQAVEGSAPAYRGTAYIVFEDLRLGDFGNRLPNFTFEVVKSGSLNSVGLSSTYAIGPTQYSLMNAPYYDARGVYVWHVEPSSLTPKCSIYLCPVGGIPSLEKTFNTSIEVALLSYNYLTSGAHGYSRTTNIQIVMYHYAGSARALILNCNDSSTRKVDLGVAMPYGYTATTWHEYEGDIYLLVSYGGPNVGYFFKVTQIGSLVPMYLDPAWQYSSSPTIVGTYSNWLYLFVPTTSPKKIFRYDLSSLAIDGTTWEIPTGMTPRFLDEEGYTYFDSSSTVKRAKFGSTLFTTLFTSPSPGSSIYSYIPRPFSNSVFCVTDFQPTKQEIRWYVGNTLAKTTQNLQTICEQIVAESLLDPTQYDFSVLSDIEVRGYTITKQSRIRDAIEPLMSTYMFDLVEEDNKLVAKKASSTLSKTLNQNELGTYQI